MNTGTATTSIDILQDTTGQGGAPANYYYFNSDSVNWANCDYFYNIPGAKTTCTVNVSGISNNSNTMVFISKNGSMVIASLYSPYYTTISQAFISYVNSIPVGSTYTIGAITFDGTNYHYTSQQVTMTNNMVINLPPPMQTTKSQIEINLNNLP